jgi:hypothetical protein
MINEITASEKELIKKRKLNGTEMNYVEFNN